jgi:hypothetical protein
MKRTLIAAVVMLALVAGFAVAQDLTVDYRLDVSPNSRGNYFTFTGPIRYMTADKDHFDAGTGASVQLSTQRFQAYLLDVKGKVALSNALRGLFLFAVSGPDQRTMDNFTVNKAADGTITIQYIHRGTAYRIVTDRTGKVTFPNANIQRRVVGYIQGAGPQVLHRDFSADGTAARANWNNVWSTSVAGGKTIAAGVATKTGDILQDVADASSMFYWSGTLQFAFNQNVLTVTGGLNAVKR